MWIAGRTIWLGSRCISCRIRSPKSDSTTSIPRSIRKGFRPHSSASIDLLLMKWCTLCSFRISYTMAQYSSASFAQCTIAPLAVAFFSNSSRSSSRWLLEYSFSSQALLRSSSHSGTSLLILSLLARTIQRVSLCHAAILLSCKNFSAAFECLVLMIATLRFLQYG